MSDKTDSEARKTYDDAIEVLYTNVLSVSFGLVISEFNPVYMHVIRSVLIYYKQPRTCPHYENFLPGCVCVFLSCPFNKMLNWILMKLPKSIYSMFIYS